MSKTYLPEGYKSTLSVHDTQIAIGSIKYIFNNIKTPSHIKKSITRGQDKESR